MEGFKMNESLKPVVNKIMSKYIILDTAQIMEGYTNTMSVISNSEIIFNARGITPEDIEINTYLNDKRRKYFPYSDTPMHYRKKLLKDKLLYINMLLEINKPYLIIKSGIPLLYYITEINDEFVLIKKPLLQTNYNSDCVSNEKKWKLLNDLMACEDNEKLFIIDQYGRQLNLNASQEEKHKKLIEFLDYLDENNLKYEYNNDYLTFSCLDQVLDKIPITSIINNTITYFIKVDGDKIKVKVYEENQIGTGNYRIKTGDIEIDSLESILETITDTREYLEEPVISKRLNKKLII